MKRAKRLIVLCLAILVFLPLNILAHTDESYPQRIISLGPSITETLYLLGVEDRLVGVTTYCIRPPQAQKKEKIGTAVEVNVEKVVSLRPDLVVATSLTDLRATRSLRGLKINVVTFSQPENFTKICSQFAKLAKLVGKESQATQIIGAAKNRITNIGHKVSGLPKPRVFLQIGAKPLFTVTRDSFINDFIEFAGGINIAKDARVGLYSREEVLRKNPDVIIIVTMGITGEREKETWAKYKTLNAINNNRIYIIDSYKLCSPTPLSFAESLEEIAYILHPQIRGE